ncbi:pantetheine-phosphate adenylyltransferase [Methylocella silvestris BL2]|uniref:Phosphopantetheine adenylyltransferase n=1 Tax=Methylocella silvestris (strain DSM 15510 / CIP 108128 / LMG 27833 / NCIMB 13906 / BL2) TaxID=395965 RepID=COAD_METSB|nr:pantetheine-phosphate adenylyltransferase [Methylocella silvestris]B8EIU8.1 RecName: Full=Phosphopantetheine adenylyltransferase; AltName: Full=Dephospho-CoA pyrophosphorylase; AltName: Full=Pantetheine-phosphate adenylyltransferase; Short=PPAT [Methylocella silvestris BL2]ACK52440.1 pantetheine-phosphate adenylyltransferase [Methylocella silvestris BL2]
MNRIALYTGSFDPLTNGHLDVITSAASICDELVVGIGAHPSKAPLFSVDERAALIDRSCRDFLKERSCRLSVQPFFGLAVEAARAAGARILIRGLRNGSDFDYEAQMAGMNAAMAPEIRTVFFVASPGVGHITATLVRQIAAMGGDVSHFVPQPVLRALEAKSKTDG